MAASDKLSFAGEQLKLLKAQDGQKVAERMAAHGPFRVLEMTNNTLAEEAAAVVGEELKAHPELQECLFSDFFTGRLKTEIPPALHHLFTGIAYSGARLTVLNLADNAFGPVVAPTLVQFLRTPAAFSLQVLNLNNQGLGITGGTAIAEGLEETVALAGGEFQLRVFVAGRNRLETPTAKAFAKAFAKIGSLEEVSLPQNGIYPDGIAALAEAFAANPHLKRLNLSDNTVKPEGAESLAEVFVTLEGGSCEGIAALAEAFAANPHLKRLNLSDNTVKPEGAESLAEVFVTLEGGSCEGIAALAEAFAANPHLKRLNLSDNTVKPEGAESLAEVFVTLEGGSCEGIAALAEAFAANPHLKRLNLSDNTVKPEGAESLAEVFVTLEGGSCEGIAALAEAFAANPHLKRLNLSDNTVKPEGAESLAEVFVTLEGGSCEGIAALAEAFAANPHLKRLNLSDNTVKPEGAESLAEVFVTLEGGSCEGIAALAEAFAANPHLKRLNLSDNTVKPEGAESLAEVFVTLEGGSCEGIAALAEAFAANPHLKRLNLSDNTVKPEGAESLAEVFVTLEELESVSLRDCLMKSMGASHIVEAVAELPLLRALHLDGNEIGPRAAQDFVYRIGEQGRPVELTLGENCYGGAFAAVREAAAEAGAGDLGASDDDAGSLSGDEEYEAYEDDEDYEDVDDDDEQDEAEEASALPPGTSPMRRDGAAKPTAAVAASAGLPSFSFSAIRAASSDSPKPSLFGSPSPNSPFAASPQPGGPSLFGGSAPNSGSAAKSSVPFSFAPARVPATNAKAQASQLDLGKYGSTAAERTEGLWDARLAAAFAKLPKALPALKEVGPAARASAIYARMEAEVGALDTLAGLLAELGTKGDGAKEVSLGLCRRGLSALAEGFAVPLTAVHYVGALYNHLAGKTLLLRSEEKGHDGDGCGPLQALLWLLSSSELWRETGGRRPGLNALLARANGPSGSPLKTSGVDGLLQRLSLATATDKENAEP